MTRVMLIPAAGRGSRLGGDGPKVLHPVAGRPMIDHLVERYQSIVDAFVIVVHPDVEPLLRAHGEAWPRPVAYAYQSDPTGMLDAIVGARPAVAAFGADEIWITWCDQVAILPETVERLAAAAARSQGSMVLTTVDQPDPYIHFVRDADDRIVSVLQRREGDDMPEVGESDTGLFVLPATVLEDELSSFLAQVAPGAATGETNFLPFVAWLGRRGRVSTIRATDAREAIGVNTPADRAAVERFLNDVR